jgi:formiminotetrahydrofolate cyclodeaminase
MTGHRSWREATLHELVTALGEPGPVPAAGVATAATCACAAALVQLALGDPAHAGDAARAAELGERALELIDRDEHAYAVLVEARGRGEPDSMAAARREASEPPLAIAEAAAEIAELAARAAERAPAARRGDAVAAGALARGTCHAAAALVEANLAEAPGDEPQLAQARELSSRLTARR